MSSLAHHGYLRPMVGWRSLWDLSLCCAYSPRCCCCSHLTRRRSGPVFAGCHPQWGQLRADVCLSRPTRCHSFFLGGHQSLVSISQMLFCQAQGLLPLPSLLSLLPQGRHQICSTTAHSPFIGPCTAFFSKHNAIPKVSRADKAFRSTMQLLRFAQ